MPGSSSRRSWSRASPCPGDGRSRGPPATTSSTGLAGSSSTARAKAPITDFYAEFTGEPVDYVAMVREKKHYVLKEMFASDVNRLVTLLSEVCEHQKRYRDYTRRELTTMVREVIACFPVYRSYVQAEQGEVSDDDIRFIDEAIELAKANRPVVDPELFDFLRDLLLLKVRGQVESSFVMRFQQNTGPVMAKGLEDTVFYNFNRLVAAQRGRRRPRPVRDLAREVPRGLRRDPAPLADLDDDHDHPRHQTLRGRPRPDLAPLRDPRPLGRGRHSLVAAERGTSDRGLTDRNAEYLLYQILVGAWPIDVDRATAYMLKATREAKAHTAWTAPNEPTRMHSRPSSPRS